MVHFLWFFFGSNIPIDRPFLVFYFILKSSYLYGSIFYQSARGLALEWRLFRDSRTEKPSNLDLPPPVPSDC